MVSCKPISTFFFKKKVLECIGCAKGDFFFPVKLWFHLYVCEICVVRKVELTLFMHSCCNFLILFPIKRVLGLGLFRKI